MEIGKEKMKTVAKTERKVRESRANFFEKKPSESLVKQQLLLSAWKQRCGNGCGSNISSGMASCSVLGPLITIVKESVVTLPADASCEVGVEMGKKNIKQVAKKQGNKDRKSRAKKSEKKPSEGLQKQALLFSNFFQTPSAWTSVGAHPKNSFGSSSSGNGSGSNISSGMAWRRSVLRPLIADTEVMCIPSVGEVVSQVSMRTPTSRVGRLTVAPPMLSLTALRVVDLIAVEAFERVVNSNMSLAAVQLSHKERCRWGWD